MMATCMFSTSLLKTGKGRCGDARARTADAKLDYIPIRRRGKSFVPEALTFTPAT